MRWPEKRKGVSLSINPWNLRLSLNRLSTAKVEHHAANYVPVLFLM